MKKIIISIICCCTLFGCSKSNSTDNGTNQVSTNCKLLQYLLDPAGHYQKYSYIYSSVGELSAIRYEYIFDGNPHIQNTFFTYQNGKIIYAICKYSTAEQNEHYYYNSEGKLIEYHFDLYHPVDTVKLIHRYFYNNSNQIIAETIKGKSDIWGNINDSLIYTYENGNVVSQIKVQGTYSSYSKSSCFYQYDSQKNFWSTSIEPATEAKFWSLNNIVKILRSDNVTIEKTYAFSDYNGEGWPTTFSGTYPPTTFNGEIKYKCE